MALQIIRVKNITILNLDGPQLSVDHHKDLRDAFAQLREDSSEHAVINMKKIEFLDSMGMGILVTGQVLLHNRCEISICNASPEVESILAHSKLNQIFAIHETLAAALISLGIEASDLDEAET